MAAKKKKRKKKKSAMGLASRYALAKTEYKAAGAALFKARHGGKTIKEYNASKRKKRRGKHKKSR
jgi:hypothetical protein